MRKDKRALCLISGGLDSQLMICVLKEQGVEVKGISFESPFYGPGNAQKAAKDLGVELIVHDFTADSIELLKRPPHGFGSGLNPCIDCHARMLKRAGEMLDDVGCHYLCTGEVLNERPMSQTRHNLNVVAEDSGFPQLILRPLSALHLDPTKPELEGWVDRNKLLNLEGRSRKPQFALAEKFGLKSYPTPAGGCKLTEPNFCIRLKDLIASTGLDNLRDIELLKIGRHFRLSPSIKIIVGRDMKENDRLEKTAGQHDILIDTGDIPGPTALVPAEASETEILQAASICASYCDSSESDIEIHMKIRGADILKTVRKLTREEVDGFRI